MKKLAFFYSFFISVFKPSAVYAATSGGGGGNINLNQLIDDTLKRTLGFKFDSSITLGTIVTHFLPFFYGIAGMGLLIFLIFGGFSYLTSAGDPKKTESAKGIITTSVIGFFLIVVAFWLTQIVSFIFNLGGGFG